jgi:hypothetical protein
MDYILLSIQSDYDKFYKSENKFLIFATSSEKKCYKIKCYDSKCGCEWTQHCDLEDGLTFREVVKHNDLIEINKEEFSRLWVECKK